MPTPTIALSGHRERSGATLRVSPATLLPSSTALNNHREHNDAAAATDDDSPAPALHRRASSLRRSLDSVPLPQKKGKHKSYTFIRV